jgi:hypothetical protein
MFRIIKGKGFHITFENGYTVSVQFGPGNYADNYDMRIKDEDAKAGHIGSHTAECAVWSKNGSLIAHKSFDGNTVSNRSTPKDVLKLLNWAERQKEK